MSLKQFNLTRVERIAVQQLIKLEKEYVEQRDAISADITQRIGVPARTPLQIADLERGIILVNVPEQAPPDQGVPTEEKIRPRLVVESEEPPAVAESEEEAPATPN